METTKVLKLYKQITSNAGTPFPDRDSAVTSFKYSAKRMGNAPTISATFLHERCLDDEWSDSVYTVFNGEKYRLRNTPSSSFDSTSYLYKHNLEFVSERIVLESVYFFDVVLNDGAEDDPLSTSSDFMFAGGLNEFAERFNRSAKWSGLDYAVIVDEGVTAEEKSIKFQDQFLYNALKTMYDTFDVPFYFKGTEIHIGYAENIIPDIIRYGADDALISVNRNNTGEQIINRITGIGSDRNIPYYYPNPTPKGTISLGGTSAEYYQVDDYVSFANNIEMERPFHCEVGQASLISYGQLKGEFKEWYNSTSFLFHESNIYNEYHIVISFKARYSGTATTYSQVPVRLRAVFDGESVDLAGNFISGVLLDNYGNTYNVTTDKLHFHNEFFTEERINYYDKDFILTLTYGLFNDKQIFAEILPDDYNAIVDMSDVSCTTSIADSFSFDTNIEVLRNAPGRIFIDTNFLHAGKPQISATKYFKKGVVLYENTEIGVTTVTSDGIISCGYLEPGLYTVRCLYSLEFPLSPNSTNVTSEVIIRPLWLYNNSDTYVDIYEAGISPIDGYSPGNGDELKQVLVKRVNVQNNLMPSKYRETDGLERFYNAENGEYADENNTSIYFPNPYSETRPREHILRDEEIYPSITGMTNANREYIDEVLDVAYDKFDNDDIYPEGDENAGKYKHPYFFIKLRKFNGKTGFNLFDHAIENNPMTISMTTGSCGACEFTIGVNDNNKNTVQVDENGDLLRDDDGNVRCSREGMPVETPQDTQNDTVNNEVWIALKKDINTYGAIMPNVTNNQYVNIGDKFVILHIDLPESYVLAAEKKLEDAAIKYMAEHNSEKYSYSVKFSRIFFEENNEIAPLINENARIRLVYNGKNEWLYVTSFSYNMSDSSPLPEISIELEETITIKKGVIQQLREQSTNILKPQLIAINKSISSNELTIKALQKRLIAVEENTGTADLTELKAQVNNNTQKLQTQDNTLRGHSVQLLTLNTNYEGLKSTTQAQGTLLLKIEADVNNMTDRVANVESKVKVVVVTPNNDNN